MNAQSMEDVKTGDAREKLDRLRTELADLAFDLECRGRVDAADVAMIVSARIAELRDELVAEEQNRGDGGAPELAANAQRRTLNV